MPPQLLVKKKNIYIYIFISHLILNIIFIYLIDAKSTTFFYEQDLSTILFFRFLS